MCIICDAGLELADEFIGAEVRVRQAMRDAEAAILKIADLSPAHKKKYDHFHKALVRGRREYNRLQELREQRTLDVEGVRPTGKPHGDSLQFYPQEKF